MMERGSTRVGIVTCRSLLPYVHSDESPLLTHDDAHLVAALRQRGYDVVLLPWRDGIPSVLPAIALVRSPWDYAFDQPGFLSWLQQLEALGVAVFHGHDLCRWNSDKRYLGELAQRGLPIVPTRYLEPDDATPLAAAMEAEGWAEMVLKPVVGAGGKDTFRLTHQEAIAFQSDFMQLRRSQGWMLQPFVAEILEAGEWSLIFWRNGFSHAVRKYAKDGEFRVQDDHGGRAVLGEAPPWLQEQASQICDAITFPWLYARVDGVVVEQQLLLMELEIIEPELFFRLEPTSSARFVDALEALMAAR